MKLSNLLVLLMFPAFVAAVVLPNGFPAVLVCVVLAIGASCAWESESRE